MQRSDYSPTVVEFQRPMYSIPYLLYFLVAMFASIPINNFADERISAKYGMIIYLFCVCIFILFWGWGITGYDSRNYFVMFQKTPDLNTIKVNDTFKESESLFYLLMSAIKTIINNYHIFRLIYMATDILLFTLFIKSYCDTWLFPMCYICFFLFGGVYWEIDFIRNAKAVLIYLIGLKYFIERRYIVFFLINIIAVGFHISSIILFFGTLLTPILYNRKLVIILFLLGVIIVFSGIGFTHFLIKIVYPITSGKLKFMSEYYLQSNNYGRPLGISVGFIERFLSFIIVYTSAEKMIAIDRRLKTFIALFYMYIFICLFFSDVAIIYERVASLFKFPYWILFPLIYKNLEQNIDSIWLFTLFIFGIVKTFSTFNIPIYEFTLKMFY